MASAIVEASVEDFSIPGLHWALRIGRCELGIAHPACSGHISLLSHAVVAAAAAAAADDDDYDI
jgi:hypothetical protein